MPQKRFPVFRESSPIYGQHGEIMLPLIIVDKLKTLKDNRLLQNIATGKKVWFPEIAFDYHWHVLPNGGMVVFLSVADVWEARRKEFFKRF